LSFKDSFRPYFHQKLMKKLNGMQNRVNTADLTNFRCCPVFRIKHWLLFELPDPHSGQDGCLIPYYLQRLLCLFQNNAELVCKKPLKKAGKKERGFKNF
jgi:hypothetical protein